VETITEFFVNNQEFGLRALTSANASVERLGQGCCSALAKKGLKS
jgi:hypothetical protein